MVSENIHIVRDCCCSGHVTRFDLQTLSLSNLELEIDTVNWLIISLTLSGERAHEERVVRIFSWVRRGGGLHPELTIIVDVKGRLELAYVLLSIVLRLGCNGFTDADNSKKNIKKALLRFFGPGFSRRVFPLYLPFSFPSTSFGSAVAWTKNRRSSKNFTHGS